MAYAVGDKVVMKRGFNSSQVTAVGGGAYPLNLNQGDDGVVRHVVAAPHGTVLHVEFNKYLGRLAEIHESFVQGDCKCPMSVLMAKGCQCPGYKRYVPPDRRN